MDYNPSQWLVITEKESGQVAPEFSLDTRKKKKKRIQMEARQLLKQNRSPGCCFSIFSVVLYLTRSTHEWGEISCTYWLLLLNFLVALFLTRTIHERWEFLNNRDIKHHVRREKKKPILYVVVASKFFSTRTTNVRLNLRSSSKWW